ncbi:MAG: hypothetical protein JNJ54_01370 [Myxococcaceae bacterium]|nr:hypothetical protein [Myxococcaceae bacterium]
MRRGLGVVLALGVACWVVLSVGCVTTKDAVGGGDARLDEAGRPDAPEMKKGVSSCGAEGKGDLSVLDGRTGGPLTCLAITITAEPTACPATSECPSTTLFRGLTNRDGRALSTSTFSSARVIAVADGFATATVNNASSKPDGVIELELMPPDGFWLKVLDGEGNYLQDVSLSFKQGDTVLAQLRTNVLANVFFSQRQPFSGQPVTVEAQGFQSVVVNDVKELGEDGHTLVLRR